MSHPASGRTHGRPDAAGAVRVGRQVCGRSDTGHVVLGGPLGVAGIHAALLGGSVQLRDAIPADLRAAALARVDEELARAGLLERPGGEVEPPPEP